MSDAAERASRYYAGYSCERCGYYHHPENGCGRYVVRNGQAVAERSPTGPAELPEPPTFGERDADE